MTPNGNLIGVLLLIACNTTKQSNSRITLGHVIWSNLTQILLYGHSLRCFQSNETQLEFCFSLNQWTIWITRNNTKTYFFPVLKNKCVNYYLNCIRLRFNPNRSSISINFRFEKDSGRKTLGPFHCVRYGLLQQLLYFIQRCIFSVPDHITTSSPKSRAQSYYLSTLFYVTHTHSTIQSKSQHPSTLYAWL